MARPRIPNNVISLVESMWGADPSQNATAVFREIEYHHRRKMIGLRKVQQIVANLKRNHGRRTFPLVEWRPWNNEIESPEDTAYLLVLDAVKTVYSGRHLYQHEAKWGRRIRCALDGLNLSLQRCFVDEYGRREVAQFVLKWDRAYTNDLDGLLAYQPWKTGHKHAYKEAVEAGNVDSPIGPGWEAFVRGLWERSNPSSLIPEIARR